MVAAFDAETEFLHQSLVQFLYLIRGQFGRVAALFADKEAGVMFMAGVVTADERVKAANAVNDTQLEQEIQSAIDGRRR